MICFFGSFFVSVETVFALSAVSVNGVIPLWIIFVFCSLGMLASDLLWFSVGKIKCLSYFKKNKHIHAGYKKAESFLDKTQNNFLLLSLNKVIYGIGIPAIMYLGRRRMTYREFFKYDILVIFFWTIVMMCLGWLAGQGFVFFYGTFKSLKLAGLILLIGFVFFYLIKVIISNFFSINIKN